MDLVTFLLYVYSTNVHSVLLLHYSVAAATMFFFLEQMENQDTYTHTTYRQLPIQLSNMQPRSNGFLH